MTAVLVSCASAPEERQRTFYVSLSGNDAWSGTVAEPNAGGSDGPLATLERARETLRAAPKDMPRRIVVRGGDYHVSKSFELGPEDSGEEQSPVVWQAAPGEKVRLCGGPTLTADAFSPATDPATLGRLDPGVRGHVMQANLTELGIPIPEGYPDKFHGAPPGAELFFNGKAMTQARWPDDGWATVARIIESGSNPREGDTGGKPGVFEYAGDRPNRWNVEEGVWLLGYWCFDWYEEAIRVKSIDREKRLITFVGPHLYSLKQGNPSPRRFCAINLLEELDHPGEYYLDRKKGILYFLPPAGLAGARVTLSTLDSPVILLKDASNVAIRGFAVEACKGNAIEIRGGAGNRIEACEISNTRQLAVYIDGGAGHRVDSCDIHDTGTGGIRLGGGDRRTLTPSGHLAINNHIWDFSRLQLTYACAIYLDGVGNRAAHNLLHDSPHMAAAIGGNDHVFEYNVIHRVCTETDDCGAIYKGRNPSCRGNVIRHNFWYDIGRPLGHGNAAIYFDDGDGGDLVFGNVFFRCGEPGRGSFGTVFSHGGHDIRAENNVFVECKRALGSAPWNDEVWKTAVNGGLDCFWNKRLLEEVDITKPPYTTSYPEIVGFMDPQPGQARISRAKLNLIVMCGEASGGNWRSEPGDNWETNDDPGFIDAAKGDFRLKPDSEVFKRLPGFQPIPFEKIGLYACDLRPAPPVEEWKLDPPKPIKP